MNIDDIVFGNPSAKDHAIMQREGYLDKLLPSLFEYTPPRNSSEVTKNELLLLAKQVGFKREKYDHLFDETLLHTISEIFVNAGADADFIGTTLTSIGDDVIPVVTKLKYYFNRPRPSSMAYYYQIGLMPDFSFFTNNPSYPSGHTTLTAISCNVLGNLYPEGFERMQSLIKTVRQSRINMGLHYPSDNDMAMLVAKKVLENPEFKVKYRL